MIVRIGSVLQRLLLVVGGLVVALLLLEGALRVASLLTRGNRGGELDALLGAGRRIVCVGDSNTYGLWVKRPEAYPQVLQQAFAAGLTSEKIDVVNLGAPGTNSSRLRAKLGEILLTLRPDVILLMVGANDLWTAPAPIDDEAPSDWSYILWQHSRLFRLVYMQRRVFDREQFELSFKGGREGTAVARSGDKEIDLTWTGRARSRVAWQSGLRDNLGAMFVNARSAGVELIVLTYPSDRSAYGLANSIIREAATESGFPLVDLASVFSDACPSGNCPEIFLPDQHPTALGYQLVAAILWQHFTRTEAQAASTQAPNHSTADSRYW